MKITKKEYDALLTRLEKLEMETQRAKDVNEVQNVASKYFQYHAAFRDDLIVKELWAKKAEGIHAEHGTSGVYQGLESVSKFHQNRPVPPGKLLFHAIDTPVIEIAGDGKTAKGVFLMHGFESGLVDEHINDHGEIFPEVMMTNEPPENGYRTWAHWAWCKYGIDFIKEDGEWRIWHFHCYDLCRAPFDKNWVNFAQVLAKQKLMENEEGRPIMLFGNKGEVRYLPEADEPPTFRWEYDGLTSRYELFPEPPKPYRTFEDTFEY